MIVVSNTSPLNYLILIEQVDVLSKLYERVLVPEVVASELSRPATPERVRDWIAEPQRGLRCARQSQLTPISRLRVVNGTLCVLRSRPSAGFFSTTRKLVGSPRSEAFRSPEFSAF